MSRAIDKLVGDDKLERPVFFLQRSHCRNRHNALYTELFEPVNVRSEIELAWHKAMSAAMTSKEGDLLPFEHTEHVCVGWRAEWSVLRDFMNVSEAGHVVEPTAANNTDFCLRQDCPSKECSEPRLYNPRLPNFPNIRPTQQR